MCRAAGREMGGFGNIITAVLNIQDDADELTFLWTETGAPGRSSKATHTGP